MTAAASGRGTVRHVRPGGSPPEGTGEWLAALRASRTWGSSVSADELAAIRAAGFEPAGPVMGAAVFAGREEFYQCQTQPTGTWVNPPEALTRNQGGIGRSLRQELEDLSENRFRARPSPARAMYDARHTAIDRMQAECAVLGGHGVVGASIRTDPSPDGGLTISLAGTAVRVPGAPPLEQPFTSHLTGQDFAKLILAGWVPAGIALGIATRAGHKRQQSMETTGQGGLSNYEVTDRTGLVNRTRRDARTHLHQDVTRLGADGAVISGMDLRIRTQRCASVGSLAEGGLDYIAVATITGTAIARYAEPPGRSARGSLAVMSPQRRRAARNRGTPTLSHLGAWMR
jgi:uncharacterized protein YbjQ (UPF0145 family)